jgi:hypothetical protein
VDTRFFVDHAEVDAIVDSTAFPRLAKGHEYLAVTFKGQSLTKTKCQL